jgi:hypothetical protein
LEFASLPSNFYSFHLAVLIAANLHSTPVASCFRTCAQTVESIFVPLKKEPTDLTNRSSQALVVPMFSFQITSTLNSAGEFAPASGGYAWYR